MTVRRSYSLSCLISSCFSRTGNWFAAFTHLPLDKMAAISQTTFSSAFSWMKSFESWFKFHWSLFPGVKLIIRQHWFRQWLSTEQATSHYLNQCWTSSLTHLCGTRGKWVKLLHGIVGRFHAMICNNLPHWPRRDEKLILTLYVLNFSEGT